MKYAVCFSIAVALMVAVHSKINEGRIATLLEIAAEQQADIAFLRQEVDPAP